MSGSEIWLLALTIVLVIVAAVLAVAETAMTRMTSSRAAALVEQERKGAHAVERIVDNIERDLNAVYLAVNIVQVFQSALVGLLAARWFGALGVLIGVVVNVGVLFTFAEAAPKTWALQNPDRAALMTGSMVEWTARILRIPARALIGVANIVLPGKGLKSGPFVTEEEIIALAEEAAQAQVIEQSEHELIKSIIDFGDTIAREVMVPRLDMVTLANSATVTEAVELAIAKGFTRIPIYGEDADDVIGVVNVKDTVKLEREGGGARSVVDAMHPAEFVPETKRVSELLAEMRSKSVHIAIVVDEYGGTSGLVTLEDLLEELVGEIHDEFDTDADPVQALPNGDLRITATFNVSDLNEAINTDLPEGDWDSVGGLVFSTLGRVPEPGDTVDLDEVELIVDAVDGRRISAVRIKGGAALLEKRDRDADDRDGDADTDPDATKVNSGKSPGNKNAAQKGSNRKGSSGRGSDRRNGNR